MNILLASYGGGHVNIIIPLYRELIRRGVKPIVLGFTLARVKLEKNNIPFLSYSDFFYESDRIDDEADRRLLFKGVEQSPYIPVEETEAYTTLCFNDLVNSYGIEEARRLWATEGRSIFLPMNTMGRILKKLKPDAVITTNSPRSEKALLLKSSEMGIPSYCVNDFYSVVEMKDRTANNSYGNKIYVAFDSVKKALIENGRNQEQIVVSGNPAFDSLLNFKLRYDAFSYRKKHMVGSSKIILWIKSVLPTIQLAEKDIENELKRYANNNNDVVIVIKPHPNDARKYYSKEKNIIIANQGDNIQMLAMASNVVVTINSTVGLEAALIGKPVIQADLVDFKEKIPFSKLGIGYRETTLGLVRNRLDRILKQRRYRSRLKMRGKAAKYIIDDIMEDLGGIQ